MFLVYVQDTAVLNLINPNLILKKESSYTILIP